ncbi:MAG: hypothetical protein ACREJX_05810 [Polyangiaceae bacterium]
MTTKIEPSGVKEMSTGSGLAVLSACVDDAIAVRLAPEILNQLMLAAWLPPSPSFRT